MKDVSADEDAHAIAQDFLDRQGAVTVAGDVEATLAWCDLPCTLESVDRRVIVETEDQMRIICRTFINDLNAKTFAHMVRTCLEAEYEDRETIRATYRTRFLTERLLLTEDSYFGFVVLRRREDRWKIGMMRFAVGGTSPANWTLRRLAGRKQGPDDLFSGSRP